MSLRFIPSGMNVHCVELLPGAGGKLCRSAGSSARLTNKEGKYATLVMPSGETRRVLSIAERPLGRSVTPITRTVVWARLVSAVHLGRRPKTRGVAMSHHAHPMVVVMVVVRVAVLL